MKTHTPGFLSEEHIAHDSEQFKYIQELHEYLWRFVRVFNPGASGDLHHYLDNEIRFAEKYALVLQNAAYIAFVIDDTGRRLGL